MPTLPERTAAALDHPAPQLLPVSVIAGTPAPTSPIEAPVPSADPVCKIEFARACVRIRGDVSPATLQLVIRELCR